MNNKKEWNGEGDPPIGCECEYTPRPSGMFWHRITILGVGETLYFVKFGDDGSEGSLLIDEVTLRPLKSEEDIGQVKQDHRRQAKAKETLAQELPVHLNLQEIGLIGCDSHADTFWACAVVLPWVRRSRKKSGTATWARGSSSGWRM